MTVFAAYSEEGLDLALELANHASECRQGTPVARDRRPLPRGARVADPESLLRLAGRIRSIVTAARPAQAAALINALLAEHHAAPELAPAPSGWRLHLHPADSTDGALDAVKAATGLAGLMDQDAWATLRICAASRCDDAFRDRSRNATRRFCSRTCANRQNAERARARRRA